MTIFNASNVFATPKSWDDLVKRINDGCSKREATQVHVYMGMAINLFADMEKRVYPPSPAREALALRD